MRFWIALALAVPPIIVVGKLVFGLGALTWEFAAFQGLAFWLLTVGEWYGRGEDDAEATS